MVKYEIHNWLDLHTWQGLERVFSREEDGS